MYTVRKLILLLYAQEDGDTCDRKETNELYDISLDVGVSSRQDICKNEDSDKRNVLNNTTSDIATGTTTVTVSNVDIHTTFEQSIENIDEINDRKLKYIYDENKGVG